jgi:hypothetical protein
MSVVPFRFIGERAEVARVHFLDSREGRKRHKEFVTKEGKVYFFVGEESTLESERVAWMWFPEGREHSIDVFTEAVKLVVLCGGSDGNSNGAGGHCVKLHSMFGVA